MAATSATIFYAFPLQANLRYADISPTSRRRTMSFFKRISSSGRNTPSPSPSTSSRMTTNSAAQSTSGIFADPGERKRYVHEPVGFMEQIQRLPRKYWDPVETPVARRRVVVNAAELEERSLMAEESGSVSEANETKGRNPYRRVDRRDIQPLDEESSNSMGRCRDKRDQQQRSRRLSQGSSATADDLFPSSAWRVNAPTNAPTRSLSIHVSSPNVHSLHRNDPQAGVQHHQQRLWSRVKEIEMIRPVCNTLLKFRSLQDQQFTWERHHWVKEMEKWLVECQKYHTVEDLEKIFLGAEMLKEVMGGTEIDGDEFETRCDVGMKGKGKGKERNLMGYDSNEEVEERIGRRKMVGRNDGRRGGKREWWE